MTLEEKLKEAKILYKDANADQRYVLERLFPEIADVEDERIRKALINFFSKGAENEEQTYGVYDKDILVWIEKQGRQKNDRKEWSEEDDKKLRDCIHAIKNTYYVGCDELIHWLRDITNN